MKLAPSSYYYQPASEDNAQLQSQADLRDRIEAICLEFPGYGYRRVTWQLKREHWIVNHKKILRIMRESDLLPDETQESQDYRFQASFSPLSQSDQE